MENSSVKKPKTENLSNIVKNIFVKLDNPAAFSNFKNVYKQVVKVNKNVTQKQVLDELQNLNTYTLHKQRRTRFKRLTTVPLGYMSDVQADLADFQSVSKYNDGYKYLLVAVDVLSRQLFVAPVRSKMSKHMKEAFDIVLEKMPFEPKHIFTDKGMEFEAKEMHAYFKEKNILKYVTQSPDVKASIAERFMRTIKNRLYRYFTEEQTLRWIEPIEKIAHGINMTVNRTIGMRPMDVNIGNANELWQKMYANTTRSKDKFRYKKGDTVQISKQKGVFEKGYLPNYTNEIFIIDKVKRGRVPNYRLVDQKGEKILGKFYESEFSKTGFLNDEHIMGKVLDKRMRNGKMEYYVQVEGYNTPIWVNLK